MRSFRRNLIVAFPLLVYWLFLLIAPRPLAVPVVLIPGLLAVAAMLVLGRSRWANRGIK